MRLACVRGVAAALGMLIFAHVQPLVAPKAACGDEGCGKGRVRLAARA